MKHIVQLTAGADAAVKQGSTVGTPCAESLTGHLRVREAVAEERTRLASLFPDRDRSRWVEHTLQADRSWVLVMERFENRKWVPIGLAIVDEAGQMAFGLLPRYRKLSFSSAALRAVLQYMREYTLAVLTARIGDAEPSATKAFERAGFFFSEQSVSSGQIERLYEFVIRGENSPLNVWI